VNQEDDSNHPEGELQQEFHDFHGRSLLTLEYTPVRISLLRGFVGVG
jgi:hypothetical protein